MKLTTLFITGAALLAVAPAAFAANAKVCFEAGKILGHRKPAPQSRSRLARRAAACWKSLGQEQEQRHRVGDLQIQRQNRRRLLCVGAHVLGQRLRQLGRGLGQRQFAQNSGRRRHLRRLALGRRQARVKLNAGVNTLVLSNRETGVKVDQFFFCEDKDYTPTGIRKVSS